MVSLVSATHDSTSTYQELKMKSNKVEEWSADVHQPVGYYPEGERAQSYILGT